MKRRVVHLVTQQELTDSWVKDCRERMGLVGLPLPKTNYRVVYTLAPKHGKLHAHRGVGSWLFMSNLLYDGDKYNNIVNCLIPHEWVDQRFNRKVTPL